jgi:hypothetical protein
MGQYQYSYIAKRVKDSKYKPKREGIILHTSNK